MEDFKILKNINCPKDLKELPVSELLQLSQEIRNFLTSTIANIGGHLGGSLGVVELSIALHYVFNSPIDKIIWDTGHQSYVHKILTNRRDKMHNIRQNDGIAGFCVREESVHDIFGAGHTSTSLSAMLGILMGRMMHKEKYEIITVIGDSAMSAGIAYEAMNNMFRFANERVIIILNDNCMSISQSIGCLHEHLLHLRQCHNIIKADDIPDLKPINRGDCRNFFEIFGMQYIGIIDGHDILELIKIFQIIHSQTFSHPIILHVKTEKGHGYAPALADKDKFHSIAPFTVSTGAVKDKLVNKTYTDIFAESIISAMAENDKIVATTAAMCSGTGLSKVRAKFPKRVIDVAISEQHAVTFCGGMAINNLIPICALYSTFLQRSYDQVIHDIAIQNLPVRFMIDRAGVVGHDGPTHHGIFDICVLRILPNFILLTPSSAIELASAIKTALAINNAPSAVRYPRGIVESKIELQWQDIELLEIGKSKIVKDGSEVAIMCCGPVLNFGLEARNIIQAELNIESTVIDARFVKPLDSELIECIASSHNIIITVEDGASGGYGTSVAECLCSIGYSGKFAALSHGNAIVPHDSIANLHSNANIDTSGIVKTIYSILSSSEK